MLDDTLKSQLKSYLQLLQTPIELVASLDDSKGSQELAELLREIDSLSEKVTLVERIDDNERKPSFLVTRPGTISGLRFAGVPLGHEFTSLVLALLQIGGHPSKEPQAIQEQIRALKGQFHFETYYSATCHNCPDVVQALNLMTVLHPSITHVAIDGALFQKEIEEREIMGVPAVYLNGQPFGSGRMGLAEIVNKIDASATTRAAEEINQKPIFDVLVVGAGPAGAAAAIYAARKGIRTGIVAQRLGGQVLDTVDIENYISVPKTDGPRFAADLERHIQDYDIDVISLQTAKLLVPSNDHHEVRLESGASLKAKTIILSTGANWRSMGVPGEDEYRTKGVTYCPHCDGPLFKGKRVAVIGGGNSGVEAAIDLAGVVDHVTLLEFAEKLRADDVLQRKLHSLPNVQILRNVQTTEVVGSAGKVNGLKYTDRVSGEKKTISLEGIFVQIGLLPNTKWLAGTVALNSPMNEIKIDSHGRTNIPGVFAAGDCTEVPYKQIVIAAGEGAKAALSAFDYLIRSSAPE